MSHASPSRGEHSRSEILHAAHDLFIKQGYHGTSMRQIAQHANLALGGLYNHFSSKEQVFEAVFLTFHPYHQVLPLIASAQGDNLEQVVRNAIGHIARAVEGRQDFMNLMFIELVEFKSIHTQKLFGQLFPQGMQIMQHLVSAYPQQIRPIPGPMVLRTFLGFFFGYFLTETALAPAAPPEFREQALQQFVDIYLHGILAVDE